MTQYAIVIKSTNSGFTAKTPNHTYKEARDYSLNHEDQAKRMATGFLDKFDDKCNYELSGFGCIDSNTYVATIKFITLDSPVERKSPNYGEYLGITA